MSDRLPKPNRYALRVQNPRVAAMPMWAYSAADAVFQFDLQHQGWLPKPTVSSVEPWCEAIHGAWPEVAK